MKKYLLLISLIATTTLVYIQTTSAGLIPGTIVLDTKTSPARSCTTTPSYAWPSWTDWPVYTCVGNSTYNAWCYQYNLVADSYCTPSTYGCAAWPQIIDYSKHTWCTYDLTTYSATGSCTGTSSNVSTSSTNTGNCLAAVAWTCYGNKTFANIVQTYWTKSDTTSSTCVTYNPCRVSQHGCEIYKDIPVLSSYRTVTKYASNTNQSFTYGGTNLWVEASNSCSVDAICKDNSSVTTCVRWYTAPSSTTLTCGAWLPSAYAWATTLSYTTTWNNDQQDGDCRFEDNNYRIDTFNQLVWKLSFTSPVSPKPTLSTCSVDWLTATVDNTGPSIAPMFTTANNAFTTFVNDTGTNADQWCNMTKYLAWAYGTTAATLPGCEFYKNLNFHANASDKHPDLLEGLSFKIDDVSGISEIKVEIGKCTATYTIPSTAINAGMLVSTTADSWVNANHKNIVLHYNSTVTTDGSGGPWVWQNSLLTKMGVGRLDSCLDEGKNYIKVTARDNVRSDNDGVTVNLTRNTSYWTSGNGLGSATTVGILFIKVDGAGPMIKLTSEAAEPASSNATPSQFIAPPTIQDVWKNFTISGDLKSWDPFGILPTPPPSCTVYSGALLTCTWAKPAGTVWTSPSGVDGVTGKFTGVICDGVGPIPDTTACAFGCTGGKVFDTNTNTCVTSSNLFILFDSGTTNTSGTYAAKLSNDSSASHGLMNSESKTCATPLNATSSSQWRMFSYLITGTYSFPTAPVGPFPITPTVYWLCTPICNLNYSHNGLGNCIANKRNFACNPPSPIVNTVWNGPSSITQTWDGSAWMPILPTTTYDLTAGTCHFKCATGYVWDGGTSSCIPVPVVTPPPTWLPICTAGGTVPCVVWG